MKHLLSIAFSLLVTTSLFSAEKVTFQSEDGVDVVADLYIIHPDTAPFVVLFHQAGWSRGEYLEIAPKLNQLGYNCMAVDQRSGKGVNNVNNETFINARKMMKETKYSDALPDIAAAVSHAKTYLAKGQLIIWGSSYSSSLVLKFAGDNPDLVDGVLAFSPGEYFKSMGKPGDWIANSASNIKCPSFITSARSEKNSWWKINEAIQTESKTYFLPETMGNHGSRALWSKFPDHKAYWEAVTNFLNSL